MKDAFKVIPENELYKINGGQAAAEIAGAVAGVAFGRLVTCGDDYGSETQNTLCQFYANKFSGGKYGSDGSVKSEESSSNTSNSGSSKKSKRMDYCYKSYY